MEYWFALEVNVCYICSNNSGPISNSSSYTVRSVIAIWHRWESTCLMRSGGKDGSEMTLASTALKVSSVTDPPYSQWSCSHSRLNNTFPESNSPHNLVRGRELEERAGNCPIPMAWEYLDFLFQLKLQEAWVLRTLSAAFTNRGASQLDKFPPGLFPWVTMFHHHHETKPWQCFGLG